MRGNDILQRIHVAYNLVRYGRGKCRIMTCGKCKGICILPITEHPEESSLIDKEHRIDSIWSEAVQCIKCGAVCHEIQLWNFDGDITKINKGFTVKERKK